MDEKISGSLVSITTRLFPDSGVTRLGSDMTRTRLKLSRA